MTKKNDISDDDKDIFQKAMQNVTPLKHKKNFAKEPKPQRAIKPRTNYIEKPLPSLNYIGNKYQQVLSDEIISFSRSGVNRKQLTAIESAKERYTARIDLHGLATDAAAQALHKFIINAHLEKHRVILVIHGKGGKDHRPPVIKNIVNDYLKTLPQVLAFHSAKPKDGGTGAVYVLLKGKNQLYSSQ